MRTISTLCALLAMAGCGTSATTNDTSPPHEDTGVPHDAFTPPALDGSTTVPSLMGCQIFPADNAWNQDVSAMPLSPMSSTYIAAMHPTTHLHPDWGAWSDHYGIPWQAGSGAAPVSFMFVGSTDESDPRPCAAGGGNFCYPIPTDAHVEGGPAADSGSDRHLLYVDTTGAPSHCTLFEVYNAQNFTTAPWVASNGAIFDLGSNTLRPDGWTSSDAAGLSVLAGLVRVDEVLAGAIRHAVRFTMNRTQHAFIHPATHYASSSTSASDPPMGLRLRLRASFDTSAYTGPALVILTAMQHYGIILADNGSDWFVTGDSDDRWTPLMDDIIAALRNVTGGDFEVVDTGPLVTNVP